MRNFCKILLIIAISACLTLPFIGCKTCSAKKNCGGIVDSVVVTDLSKAYPDEGYTGIAVTITINENSDKEEFYYTSLFISQTAMNKYNCKTLDEIVINQNYIDDIANYKAQQSAVKSGTTSFTFTNRNHDCLYILIFESSGDFNDTLIPVADPSTYIGWIKF